MAPRLPKLRGDLVRGSAVDAWSGASGPFFRPPIAVAIPEDTEDVSTLVRWAVDSGTPIVPRGAGSGMPGGNVGPWIVVDLTRLDRIELPSPERIVAGAGAVAADARAAAQRAGRDLPALPSSAPWCTLGGITATDAAGARSFLFGPAHAWVDAVEVVGRDGEPQRIRRGDVPSPEMFALHARLLGQLPVPLPWPQVRKNASGYALDRFVETGDPLDLWVGSEGTLGVITGVELRTFPHSPERGVALLGVPALECLPRWAALASGLGATACEWFGPRLIELGGLGTDERLEGLDQTAGVCLVEVAGEDPDAVRSALASLEDEVGGHGEARVTVQPDRVAEFWALRHDASPRIEAHAGPDRRSTQFIEDCVVPLSALPSWITGLDATLSEHDLDAVLFGHAGDGNIHVNPLLDLSDPTWRSTARAVLEAVVDLTASAGGTLSGEHGDGRLRAPFAERIWGAPVTQAFADVKRAFDPTGVFNPGVILPLPGQDPLEGFGDAPDFADRNRGPAHRRTTEETVG